MEHMSRGPVSRENPEYRSLEAQHREFEQRLATLQRKRFLNPEEQLEQANIKKQKLRLKDRMAAMAVRTGEHR